MLLFLIRRLSPGLSFIKLKTLFLHFLFVTVVDFVVHSLVSDFLTIITHTCHIEFQTIRATICLSTSKYVSYATLGEEYIGLLSSTSAITCRRLGYKSSLSITSLAPKSLRWMNPFLGYGLYLRFYDSSIFGILS